MEITDYSIGAGESVRKFDGVDEGNLEFNFLSIVDATKVLGFRHTTYTRKLLLEGQLEGIKVKIGHREKWFISKFSCSHYRTKSRKRAPRRYVLRIVTTDEVAVREALDKLDIDYSLEFAYNGGK